MTSNIKHLPNLLKLSLVTLILFFSFSEAFADEPINTLEKSGLFSYKPSGVAIRGFDTVAYFNQNKPVVGLKQFTTTWQGASWRFSSQKNLDLFKKNPNKYAPQYGGYCAYGVAVGSLVKIEPSNWTIVQGKLYLNYNDGVQKKWEKNRGEYIKKGNAKFKKLLKQ